VSTVGFELPGCCFDRLSMRVDCINDLIENIFEIVVDIAVVAPLIPTANNIP
jgi:hypothetical protein